MRELVNDFPDPTEHSNEIDDTVASRKHKTRLISKKGLSPNTNRQKRLLKEVDGDGFDNVLRARAKANIKKTSIKDGRPQQSETTICSSDVEGLELYAALDGNGIRGQTDKN